VLRHPCDRGSQFLQGRTKVPCGHHGYPAFARLDGSLAERKPPSPPAPGTLSTYPVRTDPTPRRFEVDTEAAWRALDDIIFDVLGLTQGERDAVYEGVINLVEARLSKARSPKRRR